MTPRKLIRKLPAPYSPASCTSRVLVCTEDKTCHDGLDQRKIWVCLAWYESNQESGMRVDHQLPLVEDLECKGEDDDAQEAHQEVAGAIKASILHIRQCSTFIHKPKGQSLYFSHLLHTSIIELASSALQAHSTGDAYAGQSFDNHAGP